MQTAHRKRTQSQASRRLVYSLIVFFSFAFNIDTEAQNPISFNARSGFFWAQTKLLKKYGNSPVLLIGLELRDKESYKPWRRRYNFPDQGWSFNYAYLSNPVELGSSFFINRFMDLHLIKRDNYLVDFRMASGLAYLTRTYYSFNQSDNVAIGSKLNLSMRFELWNKFYLKSNRTIALGIGISHFSNASFASPNYGINIPSAGFKYELNSREIIANTKLSSLGEKHERLRAPMLSLGYSLKEKSTPGGQKFPVFVASLWMNWNPQRISLINSIDYTYNTTHSDVHPSYLKGIQVSQIGAFTGLAFNLDKASLFSGAGFYLHNPGNINKPVYFKAGAWYELTKHFYLGTALKWHYFRADYLEMFVAYNLK